MYKVAVQRGALQNAFSSKVTPFQTPPEIMGISINGYLTIDSLTKQIIQRTVL
jgi:hypothetical protein